MKERLDSTRRKRLAAALGFANRGVELKYRERAKGALVTAESIVAVGWKGCYRFFTSMLVVGRCVGGLISASSETNINK